MTLDELLIGIGVKADTTAVTDFNKELGNTTTKAVQADKALANTGQTANTVFGTVAKVGAIAFTALQTAIGGAWVWLNSYIDKVEELQESEDASIRTTAEQVEMAKKYKENMSLLGKTIENIKTRIALQFLPTMYDLSAQYAKLLDDNKKLIADGIAKLLEAVAKAIQVINNVRRFIKLAVESTVGWKVALTALAIAFTYLRRAMILAFITNPVVIAIAVIGALALLIDDFMTYLDGGKSEFGDFWGELIKWTKISIQWLKDFWVACIDVFNHLVSVATDAINAVVKAWHYLIDAIITALTPIYNYIKNVFNAIWRIISGFIDLFKGAFKFVVSAWHGDLEGAKDGIGQFSAGVVGIFGGMFDFIKTQWNAVVDGFTLASDILKSVFVAVVNGLIAVWKWYIEVLKATWSAIIDFIVSAIKGAANLIKNTWSAMFDALISFAKWFVTGIGNVFKVVGTLLIEPFQTAFDWIVDKFKTLPNMLSSFVNKATFGLSGKIMNAVSDQPRQTIYNGGATNANITVNGAGNPQAVANNVTNNLNVTAQRNVMSPYRI